MDTSRLNFPYSTERESTMDDLLWDIQRLAEVKPIKVNETQIQMHKANRRTHALLVRGAVFEHAFNFFIQDYECDVCAEREAERMGY